VERHRRLLSAGEESDSHLLMLNKELERRALEERMAAYQRRNSNQEDIH